MNLLRRLFTPIPDPRETLGPLWQAVVAEARRPEWYRAGVEDTVAGRFDMVTAVLSAVLLRMERHPDLVAPSALLTELFIHDMDGQLRELGIGDVVVGKHVGRLMGAMGGRLTAYRDGLAGDVESLVGVVRRNVTLTEGGDAAVIAAGLSAVAVRLDRTADTGLLAGKLAA